MRISRHIKCLIVTFFIILTCSSMALANATQSVKTAISVPVADAKEIIADNAALLAENNELKNSLAMERENTKALIIKMDEYIKTSEQEAQLLREQNKMLQEQIIALNKKIKIEHAKGFVQGVPIGAVIGALLIALL